MIRIFVLICLICPLPAIAQNVGVQMRGVAPKDFVAAFAGNCLQNPGRPDKVEAFADLMKFPEVPAQLRPLVEPQELGADYSAWLANSGDGAPYLLALSRGKIRQKEFEICTVSNPFIATAPVVELLLSIVGESSLLHEETAAGQKYRVYAVPSVAADAILSITNAEPMGYGGATLALMAPGQN